MSRSTSRFRSPISVNPRPPPHRSGGIVAGVLGGSLEDVAKPLPVPLPDLREPASPPRLVGGDPGGIEPSAARVPVEVLAGICLAVHGGEDRGRDGGLRARGGGDRRRGARALFGGGSLDGGQRSKDGEAHETHAIFSFSTGFRASVRQAGARCFARAPRPPPPPPPAP